MRALAFLREELPASGPGRAEWDRLVSYKSAVKAQLAAGAVADTSGGPTVSVGGEAAFLRVREVSAPDTDGDGMLDWEEYAGQLDHLQADTDADGKLDAVDDDDGDGYANLEEVVGGALRMDAASQPWDPVVLNQKIDYFVAATRNLLPAGSETFENGSEELPFSSLQQAIAVAREGAVIGLLPGNHIWPQVKKDAGAAFSEGVPLVLTKSVKIVGLAHRDYKTVLSGPVLVGAIDGAPVYLSNLCLDAQNEVGQRPAVVRGQDGARLSVWHCTFLDTFAGTGAAQLEVRGQSWLQLVNSICTHREESYAWPYKVRVEAGSTAMAERCLFFRYGVPGLSSTREVLQQANPPVIVPTQHIIDQDPRLRTGGSYSVLEPGLLRANGSDNINPQIVPSPVVDAGKNSGPRGYERLTRSDLRGNARRAAYFQTTKPASFISVYDIGSSEEVSEFSGEGFDEGSDLDRMLDYAVSGLAALTPRTGPGGLNYPRVLLTADRSRPRLLAGTTDGRSGLTFFLSPVSGLRLRELINFGGRGWGLPESFYDLGAAGDVGIFELGDGGRHFQAAAFNPDTGKAYSLGRIGRTRFWRGCAQRSDLKAPPAAHDFYFAEDAAFNFKLAGVNNTNYLPQYKKNTASPISAAAFARGDTQPNFTCHVPTSGVQAAVCARLKQSYAATLGARTYTGVLIAMNRLPHFGQPVSGQPLPAVGSLLPYIGAGTATRQGWVVHVSSQLGVNAKPGATMGEVTFAFDPQTYLEPNPFTREPRVYFRAWPYAGTAAAPVYGPPYDAVAETYSSEEGARGQAYPIVINEARALASGTGAPPFVELFNTSSQSITLPDGAFIRIVKGRAEELRPLASSDRIHQSVPVGGLVIPARGYALVPGVDFPTRFESEADPTRNVTAAWVCLCQSGEGGTYDEELAELFCPYEYRLDQQFTGTVLAAGTAVGRAWDGQRYDIPLDLAYSTGRLEPTYPVALYRGAVSSSNPNPATPGACNNAAFTDAASGDVFRQPYFQAIYRPQPGDPTQTSPTVDLFWGNLHHQPATWRYGDQEYDEAGLSSRALAVRGTGANATYLLGLLSPLSQRTKGNALIIRGNAAALDTASGVSTTATYQKRYWATGEAAATQVLELNLGGHGIVALSWAPALEGGRYLIISGPPSQSLRQRQPWRARYSLWTWDGTNAPVCRIKNLRPFTREPVAVTHLVLGTGADKNRLLFGEQRFAERDAQSLEEDSFGNEYLVRQMIHWPVSILGPATP